jgi:replicative DNA helicase
MNIEQAIIGDILIINSDIKVSELEEKYFLDETNKNIFKAMKTLLEEKRNIDIITLEQKFQIDKNYLLSCITLSSQLSNFNSAKRLLVERWVTETTKNICRDIDSYITKNGDSEGVIDGLQEMLDEAKDKIADDGGVSDMSSLLQDYMEEMARSKSIIYTVKTTALKGESQYDIPIVMKEGHLVSVVARAKSGKTTMMMQMALDAEKQGAEVLIFSLEMSQFETMNKLMAIENNVNPKTLDVRPDDFKSVQRAGKAMEAMVEKKICFAKDSNILHIVNRINSFARTREKCIIFIDQLQFLNISGKERNILEKYDIIINMLKVTAKEAGVAIVLAHQMNRDILKREGKFPIASDIKSSGKVEETSDLIIMFQRPETENCCYARTISRFDPSCDYVLPWDEKLSRFATPDKEYTGF